MSELPWNMAWDTGPIPTIESARDERDWFKAIILCAIHLERYGYLEVKRYLEFKKVSPKLVKHTLDRVHLFEIANYLLAIDIISDDECKIIKEINE